MTGRLVDVRATREPRGHGRAIAVAIAGISLLILGLAIGSRISSRQGVAQPVTVTVTATTETATARKRARPSERSPYPHTRQGAVAAAASYLSKLEGALVDANRVQAVVRSIASPAARDRLAAAYAQAARQAREQLGIDSVPTPVVILRAAPIGFKVDGYTPRAATISIWRVGLVGSGATVTPQQSWRTETVALIWLDGTWRVASLASSPGPTPPLTAAASTATDLFMSIPRYQVFSRVDP